MKDIGIKSAPVVLLALFWVPGCGSGTPPAGPNVAATHGGNLLTLPGGKGFVEFVVEGPATKAEKNPKSQVIVYFLKADGSGPLDTTPSDVSFTPEGGSSISLKPAPDASKTGRFESDPGQSLAAGREVSGELSASVAGESVKVSIVAR
jgi:hypothetical protein